MGYHTIQLHFRVQRKSRLWQRHKFGKWLAGWQLLRGLPRDVYWSLRLPSVKVLLLWLPQMSLSKIQNLVVNDTKSGCQWHKIWLSVNQNLVVSDPKCGCQWPKIWLSVTQNLVVNDPVLQDLFYLSNGDTCVFVWGVNATVVMATRGSSRHSLQGGLTHLHSIKLMAWNWIED